MRGLTPLEREMLARRAANAPRARYSSRAPEGVALLRLKALGRTRSEFIDGLDGITERHHITDLGRLALRVCPVEGS